MSEDQQGAPESHRRTKHSILTVWGGEREFQVGDWALVSYGGTGTQVARIVGIGYIRAPVLRVRVRKWRKSSRRWTDPIVISARAILQGLSAAEARARAGPHAGIEA